MDFWKQAAKLHPHGACMGRAGAYHCTAMTPRWPTFFLAVLLFLTVAVFGCFILLLFERISLG